MPSPTFARTSAQVSPRRRSNRTCWRVICRSLRGRRRLRPRTRMRLRRVPWRSTLRGRGGGRFRGRRCPAWPRSGGGDAVGVGGGGADEKGGALVVLANRCNGGEAK